jgi:Clp amino terminal domain, pathogenicity island component/ClpX C4-type zinc finger
VFERFTDRARRVLVLAQEEARLLHHNFIGTEHLLLGLIHEGDGVAAQVIEQLGISLEDVRTRVQDIIGRSSMEESDSRPFTPRAKKVLELSLREALQLGHNDIGTEHILLGLIREGEGVGAQVLIGLGVDPLRVRQDVVQVLSNNRGVEGVATSASTRSRVVQCSFCGRRPPESGRLVSGQGGTSYICERCVAELTERLADTSGGARPVFPRPVVITGDVPDDEEKARAEVATAFTAVFVLSEDRRTVPHVEGGEFLGACLKEAQERHAALRRKDHAVIVDSIEFVDGTHASVSFTLSLEGLSSAMRTGDALMIDSVWKVTRSTFCELMNLAGVTCPAEK